MIRKLLLQNFANHTASSFSFEGCGVFFGPNGSGKTNVLDALSLLLNTESMRGKSWSEFVPQEVSAFSLSALVGDSAPKEVRVSFDAQEKKAKFFVQGQAVSKSKYKEAVGYRALSFSPLDVSLLYGAPEGRRSFLDTTLFLAYPSFEGVKKQYAQSVKNRNKVLKMVNEGLTQKSELDKWDMLLMQCAMQFYDYRERLVAELNENMTEVTTCLQKPYTLAFRYISKTNPYDRKGSMEDYLRVNRDRDILLGHTYIGPHLDDFSVDVVLDNGNTVESSAFLSFGENKTVFLGLKMLQVRFLEKRLMDTKIVLLFDDVFAELDSLHQQELLSRFGAYQFFLTGQEKIQLGQISANTFFS